MLTKQDLNSIRGIVKEEVRTELVPVRKDISNLKDDVANLKSDVINLKDNVTNLVTGVTKLQKGGRKLRSDLTKTINFFDKSELSTREKFNKTRTELGLHEITFAY